MFSPRKSLAHLLAQRSGSYEVNSRRDHNNNNNTISFDATIESYGPIAAARKTPTTTTPSPDNDRAANCEKLFSHQTTGRSSSTRSLAKFIQLNQRKRTKNPDSNQTEPPAKQQNQDGVTLCTLGVGTTFGASVMPGNSHSVSVVTSDDCTLLRVRRADFQEIFNEQSHLINDVESSPFCSASSLNFRLILGKRPRERTAEEVDIVFEELQHLKALGHLTNSVKKELAACVSSEHHAKQNTVIFNQGDPGHCWYIILRGSVNVVIVGKGVVCTLHEGDDFGKLALVNDAPRAATIVTNEPNCYFLRVDKHNFNTILRDVEANTVRLKEHGR